MTRPVRRAGLLALAALVAGCMVGPDYRRPATATGPSYANAKLPEYRNTSVDQMWWRQFRDPKLNRLIDLTVRQNRDIKTAEANLRQARALFLSAGLYLLPEVTSHANHTSQLRSLDALNRRNFVPRELDLFNTGFDAYWELDFYGHIRRNIEAQEAVIERAEADRRDLIVSLVAETARNYFELRGHQLQLEVARRNAGNQQRTLELTQVRLEAGVGTELDTSRAKAQLDTTLATIPPIEAIIRQDIHRIGVLTGQMPATFTTELLQSGPLPEAEIAVPIGRPADLLRRRPDIRAAERNLAAATSSIGVAVAELFPKVTFVGTFALEANTIAGLGAAGSGAYNFGPRITWPAFNLGQVYARIKAADARAEASLAQYEQTVLNALEETENALVIYNRSRERQALLKTAAEASQKAYELVNMLYQDGVVSFLNVLDTERRLLEDQRQYAQSRTTTAASLVALFKALGGGWEGFERTEDVPEKLEEIFRP